MSSPREEFWAGVRAVLPLMFGVAPFGMIYGVLALANGLPPLAAQAISSIVFAGSAQFIAVGLFGAGSPLLVLWLTTFVVNIRHMLYSASVAPYTKHLSRKWRWLLAYLLTDEAFVVAILHYEDEKTAVTNKHYFLLGTGLTLWVWWQISTAIGIFLGTQVPESWSLDFTLALTFIGMVVPLLKNRPNVAAAVAAGVVGVLTLHWPYKLGLIVAALAGIAAGFWLDSDGRQAVHSGEKQSLEPRGFPPARE